jgi:predicted transcriptional regulator
MFFKDWQVESLRYLWSVYPEGVNSRAVWENVNESLQGSISRASIINYLNAMVDEGLVTYTERTGKGGHHRVYSIAFDEKEFKAHIAERMISKLLKEYPQETKKALQPV